MSDRKPPWLTEPSPIERLRHCWVTADEHGRVPALPEGDQRGRGEHDVRDGAHETGQSHSRTPSA